ncbi:MAG: patatin-like phospholipase family protein [Myxococcota bacterium]
MAAVLTAVTCLGFAPRARATPPDDRPPEGQQPEIQPAPTARAEPPPRPAGAVAQVLTVSGGVSLGVYQAGFLYLTSEWFARHPERARLRVVTGASAGSINGVIAAMSACLPPQDDPRESLGWQTWMPLGYSQLFRPDEVTAVSAFSRRALLEGAERLRTVWDGGLSEPCDVIVGVAVTRLDPLPFSAPGGLSIPRQEEKFVFRLRSRGAGQPPLLNNVVDTDDPVPHPLLPFREDGAPERSGFDEVRDLIFASAAFPLAFAPQPLYYCMSRDPDGDPDAPARQTCESADSFDLFVDGGVFDNSPLGLAERIVRRYLVAARGKDAPALGDRNHGAPPPSNRVNFTYIDPDTAAYPERAAAEDAESASLVRTVMRLVASFVATARGKELYAMVERRSGGETTVHSSARNFPTPSALILAFFGFFEREVRRFDFYLGMYDAWRDVVLSSRDADPRTVRPWFADSALDVPEGWRPFACMVGWYEPDAAGLRRGCAGDELKDFRILLQLSLDHLYSICASGKGPARALETPHYHCQRAIDGEVPPHVDGVPPLAPDAWRQRDDESTLHYSMRLLAAYRFHFVDLHLTRAQARFGAVKLRRRLLTVLNALADAQPSGVEGSLLLTAGRAAVNVVAYEPPKDWAYATLGNGIEAGVSFLPFEWNRSWFRFNAAFSLRGLRSLLTPDAEQVAMSLSAGPEFELLFITTPFIQPMLGVRGGYQLGTGDRFHARGCTDSRARGDNRFCSQAVLQVYAAASLLERFRFQITFEQYPERPDFGRRRYDLRFGFGLHFF